MEKQITICGITFSESQLVKDIEDTFVREFDDSESAFFYSKREYVHEEEDLNFKYRYCIEVCWVDDDKYMYALSLVPTFESLCSKKQKSVEESCGCTEIYDVCSYGCNVVMASCITEGEDWNEKTVCELASIVDTIDGLRGFYLDKYVNRIGNTGWDWLRDFVCGEDSIQKALARF